MCWESFGVVRFDLGGQTSIAKHKSAYNSLINGPRGLGWYTNIGFDLGPLIQGQTRIAKPKRNHGLGIFWCGWI